MGVNWSMFCFVFVFYSECLFKSLTKDTLHPLLRRDSGNTTHKVYLTHCLILWIKSFIIKGSFVVMLRTNWAVRWSHVSKLGSAVSKQMVIKAIKRWILYYTGLLVTKIKKDGKKKYMPWKHSLFWCTFFESTEGSFWNLAADHRLQMC